MTTAPAIGLIRPAAPALWSSLAAAVRPRRRRTVSEWAGAERVLSTKESARPGRYAPPSNPLLVEIQDAMTPGNGIRDVAAMLPIQMGKTLVATNVIGYYVAEEPRAIMVVLPSEASMRAWIAQKLAPMFEATPALRAAVSGASRDAGNRADFKDFAGGQLFIEHPGNVGAARLKSKSVDVVIVDELDEFAFNFRTGDDPIKLVEGRTSARPRTAKRLYISSPTIEGASRIDLRYQDSDRRRYHIRCPDCGHEQHLVWEGLVWAPGGEHPLYHCSACGVGTDEATMKDRLIPAGRWIAENPGHRVRGYHANALYYPRDLGPSWRELVAEWLEAQRDAASQKTFFNDRLARAYQDPTMRNARAETVRQRAEDYPLRLVPERGLFLTAGVDTQDDRFEVQILAHGRGGHTWTVDYQVIDGDPDSEDAKARLVDYFSRPIEHASGALLRVSMVGHDMLGHRTEAVKDLVRSRRIAGHMAFFGSTRPNATLVGRGKAVDVRYRGKVDPNGVRIFEIGGVAVKNIFFARLGEPDDAKRLLHFSSDLSDEFFAGLISETYDPLTRSYRKRRTRVRNEAVDTWMLAYAAACHHDVPGGGVRKWREQDWDALERRILAAAADRRASDPEPRSAVEVLAAAAAGAGTAPEATPIAIDPAARPRVVIRPRRGGSRGFVHR